MNHQNLKDLFLLDPNVIFLNHGSFGACPRPVFETYQAWQRELERQPVKFLGRRAGELMAEARAGLAAYLGAGPDEVVFFTNPTTAVNMAARSLDLKPGDEILTSDHEYGAMDRTWRYICRRKGARYVHQQAPFPLESQAAFVEAFWNGVNARTRVIFLSHITSPTALIFPVKEICRRARQAGILTIVDGAHAPGQIPLDLHDLGADLYAGACHKWLMAPKGSAFLYARKEVQDWLDPLVVSWGYESENPSPSRFIDYHEWQGTRDLAAFLSVPAAIRFQQTYGWDGVRQRCHLLAVQTRREIEALTGLAPICPASPRWFGQMCAARLPASVDLDSLKLRLYEKHRIEVPLIAWSSAKKTAGDGSAPPAEKFLRLSIQGYNSPEDAGALVSALARELTF